jgi:hypothetical protein
VRRRIGLLLATALVPAILVGLLLVVLDPLDAEPEADPRAEPEAPGAPGLLNRAAGLAVRPGALTAAHAELEGLSHCLDCHGASNHVPDARCLSCHEDIGVRAARMLPLHGTFTGSCASCHPDHLGVNASLIDLDPKEFAHDRTRFPLRGAHVGLECETCHVVGENGSEEPSFHYLGVPFAACEDCHLDVHAGGERTEGNVVPIRRVALDAPLRERPPAPPEQPLASRNCADCHSETGFGWIALEPSGFAHDQDTHFDLAGKHASVQCDACHSGELRQQEIDLGLAPGTAALQGCADCHEDPHRGAIDASEGCATCHDEAGWEHEFDHDRHTRFALDPLHARIACASCHEDLRFRAEGEQCADCHRDAADLIAGAWGAARGEPDVHAEGVTCADCHGKTLAENRSAGLAARCASCHAPSYGALLATWRLTLDGLAAQDPGAERLRRSGIHNFLLARRLLEDQAATR